MKQSKMRRKMRLVERLELEIARNPLAKSGPGQDRLPKGKKYTREQWQERLEVRLAEAKVGLRNS